MISFVIPVIIENEDYKVMTDECIRSINGSFAGIEKEFIVIDNNSPLPYRNPQNNVHITRNKVNWGVSKSWNQGVRLATGEIIFFVNNDTLFVGNGQDIIEGFSNPKTMIVAPTRISRESEIEQMKSHGCQKFYPGHSGCLFGVKRKLFNYIGGFDEDFSPAFYEDMNFFARAEKSGFGVMLSRDCGVIHRQSQTSSKLPSRILEKNKKLYEQKLLDQNTKDKSDYGMVSVIVPAYNVETTISKTITSINNQTYKNIEIIVVDDCSTDNTRKILDTIPGIQTIYLKKNGGASNARNKGFEISTGRFLLFCDADCDLHPELISSQVEELERTGASFAYGSFTRIDPNGIKEEIRAKEFDRFELQKTTWVSMISVIRRKDFPGFLPQVKALQDWELWRTMIENGKDGVYVCYPANMFTSRMSSRSATMRSFTQWEKFREDMVREHNKRDTRVGIIVLSCGRADKTIACFDSVYKYTDNFDLIWVDNGSTLEDFEAVYEKFKDKSNLTIIKNAKNEGFQVGVNQGIKFCRNRYVCLLNNDTEVTENWMKKLIGHLQNQATPELGLISCIQPAEEVWQNPKIMKERIPEFSDAPDYDGDYVSYNKKLEEQFLGQWKENPHMVAFFCALIKREVLVKVGEMDERYVHGLGGDDDYCTRMKEMGYKFGVALDTFINHGHRTTFKSIMAQEEIKELQKKNTGLFHGRWGKGHLPVYGKRSLNNNLQPA